jgi:hypothetical protein
VINHPRKAIRKAAVAQIMGTATTFRTRANDRVVAARRAPWSIKNLPAIAVYTNTDDVSPDSHDTAPLELEREVDLTVEAAIATSALEPEQIDDRLDDFAREIEIAIQRDPGLGGVASYCRLAASEIIELEKGSESIGVVRLSFRTRYYDPMTEVTEDLDDFVRADVSINLGNGQAVEDRSEILVTLPT